jgi:23S rRNA (cytidine2498-2'-O)-methyltransferase
MNTFLDCVIIVVSPPLIQPALREMQRVVPDAAIVEDLGEGMLIVRVGMQPRAFLATFAQRKPIFVKHAMPIDAHVVLPGARVDARSAVVQACLDRVTLTPGEAFAVQSRMLDVDDLFTAKDIEVAVGSQFEARGAVPYFSDTAVAARDDLRVVSLFVRGRDCFIGDSNIALNLNEHCDEFRVFSRQRRTICRAEYKLLEALRKFRIDARGQHAIDLGAAPGGWTYVLAQKGFQVVAIDPGALDPRVVQHPNVTHARLRAEAFVADRQFDVLTNDMSVEPAETYAAMLTMAAHLKHGALAILTIKFNTIYPEPLIADAQHTLSPHYALLDIKSLFHNRQEVTALLRRV